MPYLLLVLEELASIIQQSRAGVVLTGAGMSAESGVPTFRGNEGLWAKFRPEDLATMNAFIANSKLVWEWYNWRRDLIRQVQPNAGHYALVELAGWFPSCTLVTQNVDDLHQRAGSRDIVSLHGSIMRARCSAGCAGTIEPRDDQADAPPTCEQCGALMRPDVVWFGEPLPMDQYEIARNAAVACDVFLSVGTSNVVEPAASLPWVAAAHGATVIVVNPTMEGQRRGPSVLAVEGPSGVLLPRLIAEAYAGKRPRRVDPSSHAGRPPAIVEPMADEVQASSEVAAEASDEGQRDVGVAQHRAAQDLTTRDEGPPAPSY